LKENKDNANINYKLGRCYLSLDLDKDRAYPYLKEASKDIKKIYDPFASDFKGAPIETYFYLARAHHLRTELDSAEFYFHKFLSESGKNHFLRVDAELSLQMCQTARELMADSVNVRISNVGSPVNSDKPEY